jgi:hypothetical protein
MSSQGATMTNQDERYSFGRELKNLREDTKDPLAIKGHTYLTRIRFMNELNTVLNTYFSENIIQNWESNATIIAPSDRQLLCGIIVTLKKFSGIKNREQADALLNAGYYAQLSEEEAVNIDSRWKNHLIELLCNTSNSTKNLGLTGSNNDGYQNFQPITLYQPVIGYQRGSAPPPPSLIVGRENDLLKLKKRLWGTPKKGGDFQVLTAIHGWPGVGKSTIASALAYDKEIIERFPDGILWTSLGQTPQVLSELTKWGRFIGMFDIQNSKTIEEAQQQLAAALRNKHMLIIIDDVWASEHAIPFMIGGSGCATLITTRLEGIANTLAPSAESIYRLKELDDNASLELLEKLAPTVVHKYQNECLSLVHALGGLPLALHVAGKLLHIEVNSGLNVVILIEELRNGAKLLESPAPANRMDLVTQTTPTIAALLKKSIDILDQETRQYFAYLGLISPKPATFDIDMFSLIWKIENPSPLIKNLVDRGLLEYVPELRRYQIHTLLVMLAHSLLTVEGKVSALESN